MPYAEHFLTQEPTRAALDALSESVLVEFGVPWCPYCRQIQATLQATLATRPGIRHLKIEDGRGLRLGRSFGVKLWPTLILMRAGHELARAVRPTSAAELDRLFNAK